MTIETILFQREQHGDWEPGIIINHGDGPIINFENEVITTIWNWKSDGRLLIPIAKPDEGEDEDEHDQS